MSHRFFLAMVYVLLRANFASAQPIVDAGPDFEVDANVPVQLQGSITNLSPIDFWVADGDHATENHLLKYNSNTGLTAVGPLRDAAGGAVGWPSDLIWIEGTLYGIDTFFQSLYTLNPDTGVVTLIGSPTPYKRLGALAYDSDNDILYAVDWDQPNLISFDRQTGASTLVMKIDHVRVHSLAWGPTTKLLFANDIEDGALFVIDVNRKTTMTIGSLPHTPEEFCDEFTVFGGDLYGIFHLIDPDNASLESYQLRRIRLPDGATTDIGPLIRDVSAHSLIINTLPERAKWQQASGPAQAVFDDESNPMATVTFPRGGTYVLQLDAIGGHIPVGAQVTIRVNGPTGLDGLFGGIGLPGCGIGLVGAGLSSILPMMLIGLGFKRRQTNPRTASQPTITTAR